MKLKRTLALLLSALMLISLPMLTVAENSAVAEQMQNAPQSIWDAGTKSPLSFEKGNTAKPDVDVLKAENTTCGGRKIVGYTRNKYGADGSYIPYPAWVSFDITDPTKTFEVLSMAGVEFYESTYDGNMIYAIDIDNNFYSVDPETFESTYIRNLGVTVNAMTYDWDNDKIYGLASGSSAQLISIDRTTGSYTVDASWPYGSELFIIPLAYIGNDEFVSVDMNSRKFYKLNKDGTSTLIAEGPDGVNSWSCSMTFNREDNLCYLCYSSMEGTSIGRYGKLYTFDPATGEFNDLGYIGDELGYYANGIFFADFLETNVEIPLVGYSRNMYGNEGTYDPFPAWVSFLPSDPTNSFEVLSMAGVEFFESTYDGNMIYAIDIDNNFYSVDPETFESTYIRNLGVTVNAMTYDWDNDKIYGLASGSSAQLISIDRTTGLYTVDASWPYGSELFIIPLAYIGNDEFVSVDMNSRKFYKLNKDGTSTLIAEGPDGANSWSCSMTFNREDNLCYLCYSSMEGTSVGRYGKLYTLDPATGEFNDLGYIGDELGCYVNGIFFADFLAGIEQPDVPTETLDEALNLEGGQLHFTTDEQYPWYVVDFQNRICATNGNEREGSTSSSLYSEVTLNAGDVIRFVYSMSCQMNADSLTFYIDDQPISVFAPTASGDVMPWTEYTYTVSEAGTYSLRWTYTKTNYWSEGHDHCWVDDVYAGSAIDVETIELDKYSITAPIGSYHQLNWTVLPDYASNGSVIITSSNTDVVSVNATGYMRLLAQGTATIRVTSQSNPEVYAECAITVPGSLPNGTIYAYCAYNGNMPGSGALVTMNPASPNEFEPIGMADEAAYAMAYAHGVVYGYSTSGKFFTTTPGSTEWNYINNNAVGGGMITSLAFNYATNRMYAVGSYNNIRDNWYLFEVDMATGVLTPVGIAEYDGILFTFTITTDGTAYGVTSNGTIYEVDLETAEGTEIGYTGSGINYCQSLIYDHDNDIMYWTSYYDDGNGFRTLDLETGEVTYYGSIGDNAQIAAAYMIPSFDAPIRVGDVDGDGYIRIADALLAMRCAMSVLELNPTEYEAADFDGNGTVSVEDALVIMRIAMGVGA